MNIAFVERNGDEPFSLINRRVVSPREKKSICLKLATDHIESCKEGLFCCGSKMLLVI
jgi:hypothetical protein